MARYRRLYWSINKQNFLPWSKYKKLAVPTYIKKEEKTDKKIRKRIESLMKKSVHRRTKTIMFG